MADKYFINQAVVDLNRAGLLNGLLVSSAEGLIPVATEEFLSPEIEGHFLGAGLDSRNLEPTQLFVALPGENVDGRSFAPQVLQSGHWVLTNQLPDQRTDPLEGLDVPAGCGVLLSKDPLAALACLASCWRRNLSTSVVGITGTNGKTTTKDMLAALLSAAGPVHATAGNFNNNLGLPLTILGLRSEHRYGVLEMGASAVGEIAALAAVAVPEVGIITNAAPAHLAEFGSLDGIIQGKGELLDTLPDAGVAVLNADSPGYQRWKNRAGCQVVSFGTGDADSCWSWTPTGSGKNSSMAGPTLVLDGKAWPVPLPGRHNGANLAAAILAARALGVSDAQMRAGLAGFSGSPHRGIRLNIAGRTVLDDCYNANPRSVLAAVKMLVGLSASGTSIAILGHMAELGDDCVPIHRETGEKLFELGLNTLVAVGQQAQPLTEGFVSRGGQSHFFANLAEASEWLKSHTESGDRLLIKGSRSAAMEAILPMLVSGFKND